MSLIVADFSRFVLGVKLYAFSEDKTEVFDIKTNFCDEISKYVNCNKEIDKIVLIGADSYTSIVKNQLSSSLETQYGLKNIKIETKDTWS